MSFVEQADFEERLPPPSRCEFVHRWLDAHQKYFGLPPPAAENHWVTGVSQYADSPHGVYSYYNQATYQPPQNYLPYVVPAPYRNATAPLIPFVNLKKKKLKVEIKV